MEVNSQIWWQKATNSGHIYESYNDRNLPTEDRKELKQNYNK
jgi:hypothetical protein